jgi:hypothetical protein
MTNKWAFASMVSKMDKQLFFAREGFFVTDCAVKALLGVVTSLVCAQGGFGFKPGLANATLEEFTVDVDALVSFE